ncbi:MAG TPA: AsmA-like C-terminal region-containing protein [Roseiarcus sp.]|nr:AsmA-like C-terminal region-containing protein [Roseiarcus sp.]
MTTKQVADNLNAAFDASARVRWSVPDAATFRVLPWPSLRIVDARLNDAFGENLVSAPEARLDLSLGELIKGRLTPVRAVLVTPVMTLDLDRPPLAFKDAQAADADASGALAQLVGIGLTNGVLRFVSKSRRFDTVLENVQGRIDGLARGDQIRVHLSAIWRDSPIAISGSLDNLERAERGEPSALEALLISPIVNLSFSGALAAGGVPNLEGEVSASVPSIKALARLVGQEPPTFLAADDVVITARLAATASEATLAEAIATSARETLQGALHAANVNGRPVVSGSFDADRLAIAPLIGPAPPLIDRDGRWSVRAFAVAPPRGFDLDLRLSAGHLDVYGRELANAAGSVILKDGVLTASLIDAAAYGGRLRGETRVVCEEEDLNVRASAKLAAADFGAAFSDFGWPAVTGQGTLEFSLETTGRSPVAAVAGLSGSASLRLEQGAVSGINLEEALRRSQRRPIDVARDMRIGGTAFDTLALEVALGRGIVHVVNGELGAHGVAVNLQGQIDLPAQAWDLRANATQVGAAGQESPEAAHLSFDIGGPWSAPTIRVTGDKEETQPAEDTAP